MAPRRWKESHKFCRLTAIVLPAIIFAATTAPAVGRTQTEQREASYGISSDPIESYVVVDDAGTKIYTETYLPTATDGGSPPQGPFPTVLDVTPYSWSTTPAYSATAYGQAGGEWKWADLLVPRGYAVTFAHAIGSGKSGGCSDYNGDEEIDAALAVVEHIARQEWSTGKIGMVGGSYGGGTALFAAVQGSDHLSAAVAFAPSTGYEEYGWDGVPMPGAATAQRTIQAGGNAAPGTHYDADDATTDLVSGGQERRARCATEHEQAALAMEIDSSYSDYWAEREVRDSVASMTTPTLMFHGTEDNAATWTWPVGFFDRIPDTTPHKLVMGKGNHLSATPQADGMTIDWFDHYLKEIDTGVEDWAQVSLEDSDGTWRGEETWPWIDGEVGQLALGSAGVLGASDPSGADVYEELSIAQEDGRVVFETPSLSDPLQISGQAVLDLWVQLDTDEGVLQVADAHFNALLQVIGPDGRPIVEGELVDERARELWGSRSARHLEPIENDFFTQEVPVVPPLGEPFRVPIRFRPGELSAPAGSHLRLTVASAFDRPIFFLFTNAEPVGTPSGADVTVTILHNCDHPSVLRFLMPKNVRLAEPGQGVADVKPSKDVVTDGGGIAEQKVCGEKPTHPAETVKF